MVSGPGDLRTQGATAGGATCQGVQEEGRIKQMGRKKGDVSPMKKMGDVFLVDLEGSQRSHRDFDLLDVS